MKANDTTYGQWGSRTNSHNSHSMYNKSHANTINVQVVATVIFAAIVAASALFMAIKYGV